MHFRQLVGQLLHGAVTEQHRARVLDKVGAVGDKKLAPLMAAIHLTQVVSLAEHDHAGFVKHGKHVAASRSGFSVRIDAQRDVGLADGALGFGKGQPHQRI